MLKPRVGLHPHLESHPDAPRGHLDAGAGRDRLDPGVQRQTSRCSVRWAIPAPVGPSLSGWSVWVTRTRKMSGMEGWVVLRGLGAVLLFVFYGLKSGLERECS